MVLARRGHECHGRHLLDAIGLAWYPSCLNFTSNLRPILTTSLWQVRQPITTKAIGRSRNYQAQLGRLPKELTGPQLGVSAA